MKKSALKFAAVAVVVGSLAVTAVADIPDDAGWVVATKTSGKWYAEERLTQEQIDAGVKPWILTLGGNVFYPDKHTVDGVSQVGDNATLDFTLPIWYVPDNCYFKLRGGFLANALSGQSTIERIILPNDASDLPNTSNSGKVFYNCTGLKTVTPFLPAGTTTIPTFTFQNCTSLEGELNLPECKTVGQQAFVGAKITSLYLGPDLTTLSKNCFESCSALATIVVAATNAWSISEKGFNSCTAIKDFTMMHFPSSVGANGFGGVTSYSVRFLVPEGIDDPNGLLASFVTPWKNCSQTVKDAFAARWPGEKHPLGLINTVTYGLPKNQFIAYIPGPPTGLMVIVR